MLILCLTAVLQLVAGQNGNLTLNPTVIPGSLDSCQFHEQLAAIDVAIHQNLDEILSGLQPHYQCGSGLWIRVAYLNMSDPSQQCPPSWRPYSANGVRACGRQVTTSTTGGYYSQNYTVQQSYQRVCGWIVGYQVGITVVFGDRQLSVDDPYVDGVSVTYGEPRRHIWTFASGLSETIVNIIYSYKSWEVHLPMCSQWNMQQPPAFVSNNISVNHDQEIHCPHLTTQIPFNTRMIHSGMVKDVKASAALTLTPLELLGSVLCCPALPVIKLRYAFVQIKELLMKTHQLDCLRYIMCNDW